MTPLPPNSLELSIVLPAYREAESLQSLLPALRNAASRLTPYYEIVVVDTMEPVDATADVCKAAGVRHVSRRGGNAYGDAVRTGVEAATGKHILFMDADGSHNPDHIARLWEHRDSYALIVGSRYVEGGATENPAILIFMSYVVNVVFRVAFRLQCLDVSNSFRLYNGDALRSLDLVCNNFDIVEEMLIKLAFGSGGGVREVPVTFEARKSGESKRKLTVFAASYLFTLIRLLLIKWSYLLKKKDIKTGTDEIPYHRRLRVSGK